MRLALLVSVTILFSACDRSTPVSIDVRAAGTPVAASYEVALFEGSSCPEWMAFAAGERTPVLAVAFPSDSPMALGGRRESGPHALAVLGRAGDCAPVSFGCTPLELGEVETVTVTLATVDGFSGPRCGPGRLCESGLCQSGFDAGPRDAEPDASPDAGPDGGAACGDGPACGDPAVVRCVSSLCQLVSTTPQVRDELLGTPLDYLETVLLAHTIDGAPSVHVGTLEVVVGGHRAIVTSLPLASLGAGTGVRTELPENAAGTLAGSMALRGDGNTLHWSVAGQTEPASTVGVWIGTLSVPGATETSLPLAGVNTEVGLGPQLTLGGNGQAIRHVSVTRDEMVGILQAGAVPESPELSDYLAWTGDPVPGGSAQTAASADRLAVMEFFGSRDIAIWRPYPGDASQSAEARPVGARGPLALAHLGADRYLLGYPVDDTVRLVATDCGAACSFAEAGTSVASGGTLNTIALVGAAGGALLVEGTEDSDSAEVTVRPVDRDGRAGDALLLWSRPATERVVAVAADFIVTGASYELIVAALSQSRSDPTVGRVGLIRVPFAR